MVQIGVYWLDRFYIGSDRCILLVQIGVGYTLVQIGSVRCNIGSDRRILVQDRLYIKLGSDRCILVQIGSILVQIGFILVQIGVYWFRSVYIGSDRYILVQTDMDYIVENRTV